MNNVVHVKFGLKRHWDATLTELQSTFRSVGELCGDDPDLLDRKAKYLIGLLKSVSEGVSVEVASTLPSNLDPEQLATVTEAIRCSVNAGVEAACEKHLKLVALAGTKLCTSVLSARGTSLDFP